MSTFTSSSNGAKAHLNPSQSLTALAHAEAQQAASGPSNSRSTHHHHHNNNSHGPHPPLPAPGTAIKGKGADKKRVSYYYDADVGAFSYGYQHPMKPHRMRMAHNLIQAYGLDRYMDVHRPKRATPTEMTRFHTDEYIDFLRMVTPETVAILSGDSARHLAGAGEDCPAFEGLWDFCSISAGGSIGAAHQISSGNSDISINWAGGLHHAKKREASGFCYVNDIVLCILELLRVHNRVLYIDIDVHHGDGVEEAFYSTDRVMTASFHKFGDFFPWTGDVKDIGMKGGKGYSVNVPFKDGITEEAYMDMFKPIMSHIMEWYRPGAVVLQCGADSLAGDKIGCFNLSIRGHAACVEFMATYNVPLVILGGGGYTVRNVARTWTYETGAVLGMELSPDLPYNSYMSWFGPEYKLDVPKTNMEDYNSKEYLEEIKTQIIDNLRSLPCAPSAPMQEVPRGPLFGVGARDEQELSNDEDSDMDERITQRIKDAHVARYGDELSDDDGDNDKFFGIGPSSRKGRRSIIPQGYEDDSEDDDERTYDGRIQDRSQASASAAAASASAASRVMANGSSKRNQKAQALLPPIWRSNHQHPPSSSPSSSSRSTKGAHHHHHHHHPQAWNADPSAIVRAFPYHNPYSRHRPKRSFFSSSARPSANLEDLRAAMTQLGYSSLGGNRYGLASSAMNGSGPEGEGEGARMMMMIKTSNVRGGESGDEEMDEDEASADLLRRGYVPVSDERSRRFPHSAEVNGRGGGGRLRAARAGEGEDGDDDVMMLVDGSAGGGGGGGGGKARDRAKERERKSAREKEWEQAREWRVRA